MFELWASLTNLLIILSFFLLVPKCKLGFNIHAFNQSYNLNLDLDCKIVRFFVMIGKLIIVYTWETTMYRYLRLYN